MDDRVWVVMNEVLRIKDEGTVLDKFVGVASIHRSFGGAIEFAEDQNKKMLEKGTKSVKMVNGDIVRTDYYVELGRTFFILD